MSKTSKQIAEDVEPSLTVAQLGHALILNRQDLPPISSDPDVQKRIDLIMGDPANVSRFLYELCAVKAHGQALKALREEADLRQREQQAASRKAGISSSQAEFAAANISALWRFVDFALADKLATQSDPSFTILLNEHSRVSCNGRRVSDLQRVLSQIDESARVCLDLTISRLTAILVQPSGVEGFEKLNKRFAFPETLSWTLEDGTRVRLYFGKEAGNAVTKTILPGVEITTQGAIPVPGQAGIRWVAEPKDVAQPQTRSGLPSLPGEFVNLCNELRGASAEMWTRFFVAMLG